MQASVIARNTSWLRTAANGGLTLCALLALAVVLPGVAGCPGGGGGGGVPQPGDPCQADADCDDSNFCNGAETCEIGTNGDGVCAAGTPCPFPDDCVENAEFCPPCLEDSDCDDGNFCNGAETCNVSAVNVCDPGTDPCDAEQTCNETDDRCETVNADDELTAANPGVTFGDLAEGDPVTLVAPDPNAAKELVNAQPVGCSCSWSADGAGTFDPDDDCTTQYTPSATDTQVQVIVICGEDVFVFTQSVTVTSGPPPCTTNGECDDGLFCNGDETCVDGACADGTSPCAAGENCIEEDDFCAAECATDADCDNGDFCDGEETCDTNGFCAPGDDPCDAGDTCDEENDECIGEVVPCNSNGDCDNDDPCDGDETCEIDTNGDGTCQDGDLPCDPDTEDCVVGDSGAECVPKPITTINFTLGQDNLFGTSAGDTFSAPLLFNEGTGVQISSLQNGDIGNGLAGTDTLNATYNYAAATVFAPTLSGIELFNLSDFAAVGAGSNFSFLNVTGVTTINSVASLADATITNISALTDLGVTNSDADLLVTYITPAGNGSADSKTLTLNGARDSNPAGAQGCTVNITTPPNGLETLGVVSTGTGENILEGLVQTTGTTMLTLNVSGSSKLTIRRNVALPGTLTTINAGSATGGTDLTVGGALNVTYTGGAGNDVINFAGTYTNGDIISGGSGTNTLGVNSGQAVGLAANQTNVTNIQVILIPDSLNGALDTNRFGPANPAPPAAPTSALDAILDTTAAANLLGGNSTINLGTGPGNRSLTLNNDDTGANTLGVTIPGGGLLDVLTLNLQNADLGAGLTITGAEPVNLVSGNGSDGTAADGGANTATTIVVTTTFGAATLNIQGPVAFTAAGAITAGTINAATAGAAFTMGAPTVAGSGASITGSAFSDTLIGSANNDSITAGEGNDTVRGDAGADPIITLGGGTDTLRITAIGAAGVDRKTVTDFDDTPGTGDIFSLDANIGGAGLSLLSGTDNFASAASIQNHGVAGNLTVAGATEVVRVTAATVPNFTDANSLNGTNLLTAIGGTITVQANGNQHLFVVADPSGVEGVYYGDALADSGIVAAELTLIATLQGGNVVLNDLVFQNFANN